MKLIVGLGNPGKEYELTRHNIGFIVLDHFFDGEKFKEKKNALILEKNINNEKVIFLKPLTYMNNSGEAVRYFANFYKIKNEDILVIHDDVDFEIGTYKIKKSGSSAGHNGIKSIIEHLNTTEFNRLRIGISSPDKNMIDFVLGKFSKEEREKLNVILNTTNNIIEDFISLDIEKLMSKYN